MMGLARNYFGCGKREKLGEVYVLGAAEVRLGSSGEALVTPLLSPPSDSTPLTPLRPIIKLRDQHQPNCELSPGYKICLSLISHRLPDSGGDPFTDNTWSGRCCKSRNHSCIEMASPYWLWSAYRPQLLHVTVTARLCTAWIASQQVEGD